jgi:heme/copper-type cytochrome/quinol oxidase subunit 1
MPVLARWMIKAALAYLVAALILGLLVAAGPQLGFPASIGVFQPVYLHLLMVGWVTQLIFGVVYWMFPKYSRERPRGSERLGWAIFWLLNVGLILRVIGEPLAVLVPGPLAGGLLAASALLQFGAGWAFVANTWGRVKER